MASDLPAVPERLTHLEAVAWLSTVRSAIAQAAPGLELRLDAAGLAVFDSAAVAALLAVRRQAQARGLGLRVHGLPERLQGLVALYGVDALLPA